MASLGLKTKTEDLKEAARQARQFMSEIDLPEGYHWAPVGGLADFNEGLRDIQRALMLSIALVFLLMGLVSLNELIANFTDPEFTSQEFENAHGNDHSLWDAKARRPRSRPDLSADLA